MSLEPSQFGTHDILYVHEISAMETLDYDHKLLGFTLTDTSMVRVSRGHCFLAGGNVTFDGVLVTYVGSGVPLVS